MYIYQRLIDLREDKDLNQKDVADVLGIKQPQYARYETGQFEIKFHQIIKLAKFYDVSIDYIAGLTNYKKKFW